MISEAQSVRFVRICSRSVDSSCNFNKLFSKRDVIELTWVFVGAKLALAGTTAIPAKNLNILAKLPQCPGGSQLVIGPKPVPMDVDI